MTTLVIIGILLAGLIGFVAGVVYQSDNGPDYDE
jgi:preprotein translocase subunit Sss1